LTGLGGDSSAAYVDSTNSGCKAGALPVSFIVALRFASDGELAGLVQSVLAGQFAKPADVKKAIQQWRPDTFRV